MSKLSSVLNTNLPKPSNILFIKESVLSKTEELIKNKDLPIVVYDEGYAVLDLFSTKHVLEVNSALHEVRHDIIPLSMNPQLDLLFNYEEIKDGVNPEWKIMVSKEVKTYYLDAPVSRMNTKYIDTDDKSVTMYRRLFSDINDPASYVALVKTPEVYGACIVVGKDRLPASTN